MKIAFICSSLEPGHDGVGDYTRCLAAALIKQGNDIAILSISDKNINEVTTNIQQCDGVEVRVMRIPFFYDKTERSKHAKNWIDQFDPQWVSLQFVPFGFHSKGLTIGLSKFLLSINSTRPWHIMFHELWVGMEYETSQKLIWWGRVQRFLIKSMIANLKPWAIHTQTILYQLQLAKLGFEAQYLPIFSNIPIIDKAIVEDTKVKRLLVFGEIHQGAPIDSLAKDVAAYMGKNQVKIILTFLGRSNEKERNRWIDAWESNGLEVELLGERPAERIAEVFSKAKLGISLTAFAISDKSGSVAAMRAFGLKILCLSRPWSPRGFNGFELPADIFNYTAGSFETFMDAKQNDSPVCDAPEIALKLLNDLKSVV